MKKKVRVSQPFVRLNLTRFGISSFVFLILCFIIIVITTNNHSSAGSVALDLSVRTWVRSQVPWISLFSFLSADPVPHNLKCLPYNLNIHPSDVLLPRTNVPTMRDHHTPQVNAHTKSSADQT